MLPEIEWMDDVADKDFDAAQAYLSLRFDERRAAQVVASLRAAELTERRANDILRAYRHKPLPLDDPGVQREEDKLADGKKLSPILVVSFEFGGDIADGYHRLSYAYHVSPNTAVPCRIASVRFSRLPGEGTWLLSVTIDYFK
jgi:transcriptional regulator of met regulon